MTILLEHRPATNITKAVAIFSYRCERCYPVEQFEGTVASLAATVKEQASQIQKVSAQRELSKPAPSRFIAWRPFELAGWPVRVDISNYSAAEHWLQHVVDASVKIT
jgi:hypothetical protein